MPIIGHFLLYLATTMFTGHQTVEDTCYKYTATIELVWDILSSEATIARYLAHDKQTKMAFHISFRYRTDIVVARPVWFCFPVSVARMLLVTFH